MRRVAKRIPNRVVKQLPRRVANQVAKWALLCLCVLFPVTGVCLGSVSAAWAVDGDFVEDDNAVNPQQLPDSSFIYDTTINDLQSADSSYHGRTVQVIGEVVGDRIQEDPLSEYCWITLTTPEQKSNASIEVFMLRSDAERISVFGKYGKRGTTLQVRGTYHLTCSQHVGISDVHAEVVSVIDRGRETPDVFDEQIFFPGLGVVVLGFVLIFVYHRLQERLR